MVETSCSWLIVVYCSSVNFSIINATMSLYSIKIIYGSVIASMKGYQHGDLVMDTALYNKIGFALPAISLVISFTLHFCLFGLLYPLMADKFKPTVCFENPIAGLLRLSHVYNPLGTQPPADLSEETLQNWPCTEHLQHLLDLPALIHAMADYHIGKYPNTLG